MTLYDQFGKEILTNKPILREVASQTVRDRYSSYPSHGLTAERLAAILKEADQGYVVRQAELFEEMEEKDAHLGSVLQTRRRAVTGLEWEIQPATDSAEDKMIADKAREMLSYCEAFDNLLFDLTDAIGKGFTVLELFWAFSEGQYWLDYANWIHQKRFTFSGPQQTINGLTMSPLLETPRLLTDEQPIYGENLLPNKFVFHRHKTRSGSTARAGIIRPCTYLYLFLNYDIKDWLVFNELFSVPMRVGKYKSGSSPNDIEVLKQAVMNLGVDAAAVISESTLIEIVESAQRGNVTVFKDFAEFLQRSMTKVVLGHAGSADSTPGKLGSEDQAGELRQDLLESDAKPISRTVRLQVLGPWKTYNFGPQANVPKFKLLAEKGEDLKAKAETYQVLITAGFDQVPVSHIHEEFGIPKPQNGEPTVKPAAAASPFPGLAAPTVPVGSDPVNESGAVKELQTTQASVLNGAQITAATAIVTAVAQGQLPRDAGIGQLKVLFNLTDEQAASIMGTAGNPQFTPTPATALPNKGTCSCGLDHHTTVQLHADPDAAWVAEYMKRLQPALQGAKKKALDEIEKWLAEQTTSPSSGEFIDKIQEILGSAYEGMDKQAINDAVADMYRYYKSSLPIANVVTAFGGADTRAIEWLAENDQQFYSKFIKNQESQDALTRFLNDRYLAGGEGLFGRGDPKTIAELKDLLSQKLTDISGFQANRIVDTSVQRIRNFSHLQKLADAGTPKIKIIEPTEECPFCQAMNGKVIDVGTAHGLMTELLDLTPDEYIQHLQDNPSTLDNIDNLASSGALPPYHPFCHGKFVIVV